MKIEKPGDTFLDLRSWGKGVVWVNGHCLGRFWNIGPTQTAYLPGCWLHAGKNEIVILDLLGPEKPVIAGLDHPILNELHPEKDFAKSASPRGEVEPGFRHAGSTPARLRRAATCRKSNSPRPPPGNYFCLESLERL